MFQVWLLGRPRFRWNGEALELNAPARAISLLTYVLVRGEQSRAALASSLWGDLPADQAGKKVRSHLWYLRESGPPERAADWLLADRRTVRWNPSVPVWIDLKEYERLAADPQTAAQALELYGGDFLAGIDDDWVQSVRARLREQQVALLCASAERARRSEEPATAAEYARRALDIEPHREEALLALVRAHGATGNRASAIEAYREFAQRLRTDLGAEPSAETAAAYAEVVDVAAIPHGRSVHNLPPPLTSFHGREREVEILQAYLRERRLVSVVGTAGIGKTRLALETARSVVQRFSDGVWFVDLAPLASAEPIWATIATTLGLSDSDDQAVVGALRRANALLILDNCEHVAVAAAEVAAQITSQCNDVSLLATSREALRTDGERVLPLAPLESPSLGSAKLPSAAELERFPTVQLFADRAADALGAPLSLHGADSRHALVRILELLDGIPLAIELVAAQMDSLSLESLARELDSRFLLSVTRSRTAPERHRTLQGTLDWSYALLGEGERQTLRSLGSFVGTWSMESANAVLAGEGSKEPSVAATITTLVRKSMVVVADRSGIARYRLLEPVRAYALERLHEAGSYDAMAHRHAERFAALAVEGEDSPVRRKALEPDLDNFRAALRWTITGANDAVMGARLIGSLLWLFTNDALIAEGIRWCDASVAALGQNPLPTDVAPVLMTLSGLHYMSRGATGSAEAAESAAAAAVESLRGSDDAKLLARAHLTRACALGLLGRETEVHAEAMQTLEFARRCGDTRRVAQALQLLVESTDRGEVQLRRELINEALIAFRAVDHEMGEGTALGTLSELEYECGNFAEARRYAMEAHAKLRTVGRMPLLAIGFYSLALGDSGRARDAARECLEASAKIGALEQVSAAVQCLGGVALAAGDPRQAARLVGASEAIVAASRCTRSFVAGREYEAALARLREALPLTELEALLSEGRTWGVVRARQEALSM